MLDLGLDGLQLLQLPLLLSEDQHLLTSLVDSEWVLCAFLEQVIKFPGFDLRQDHLRQLLVLLSQRVVELRPFERVGEWMRMNASHWTAGQATGSSADLGFGVQSKFEISWSLAGASVISNS